MKSNTKQKTKEEIATMWRYGLGSTFSYLINLAILYTLTDICGLHYQIGTIAGYTSIVIVSYILSVKWIFKQRKIASRGKEFVAFTLITIFAMVMNMVSMWVFTGLLHWHYIISNITTNFLATIWGYVPKKIFLFSESKRKGHKHKDAELELEELIPDLEDPHDNPYPFIYEDEVEE